MPLIRLIHVSWSHQMRLRSPSLACAYATQNVLGRAPLASRKQITVANDDGRVPWKDLSTKEKVARTTQKTFHLGVIVAGLIMTVRVS